MNRLNKTESAIFVSLICSLLPEDLHLKLILMSALNLRVSFVEFLIYLALHNDKNR